MRIEPITDNNGNQIGLHVNGLPCLDLSDPTKILHVVLLHGPDEDSLDEGCLQGTGYFVTGETREEVVENASIWWSAIGAAAARSHEETR